MIQGAFSIPDIDGMVEHLVMEHNLSLMALDKDKTLMAITLNGDFHRDEIDMPRQEVINNICCLNRVFNVQTLTVNDSMILITM